MTVLATHRPSYFPAGRPVRRFVAALVVLALAFGALWWTGLAAPRLSLGEHSGGMYEPATGHATARLDLHNRGPVSVEVLRITLGDGIRVTSVRADGGDRTTSGQKIAGGGAATIDIEFTCPRTDRLPPPLPHSPRVVVTVRTPVGLERTTGAGLIRVSPACPG